MKKLIYTLAFLVLISCNEDQSDPLYTDNEVEYTLFKASDFDYTGVLKVREMMGGELELEIQLEGQRGEEPYFFPAHLHFGTYDAVDAPMAHMLDPVDIRTLRSTTILGRLSNQESLDFDGFKNLDGHIKVHLADSGPEYQVILVAGNIGANDNNPGSFDSENMTLCSPYF
ncbi:hypothetical protein [Arthrospiribacter ruber]|uniref:CHRD domain-containing protein n=1 Tax=Arthrospiribacter ruber TaxID=2487934 RepID=A0A951IYC1_9BACT|nr:hypothetical protein [Arthrospiribacter ruber]MBW3468076.1 hypothetical protein [Arthrospiribacter ruber]